MSENNIILQKLRDRSTGKLMDIKTPFIVRVRPVPTAVRVPLYVAGQLLSSEDLARLDMEIVNYTQADLDAEYYAGFYAANADLAVRVKQYRDYLDGLGVGYDATTDVIAGAIAAKDIADTEKLMLGQQIRDTFQNIVVNLELLGVVSASANAWQNMPKLIQYLPATNQ